MTLEAIRATLAWCTVFDLVLLFLWYGFFVFAHDWMYRLHGKQFKLTVESFDAIHYSGMGLLKLGMILFHFAPYLALRIVG